MGSYRLCSLNRPSPSFRTHPRERPEGIVCENVDSLDSSKSVIAQRREKESTM